MAEKVGKDMNWMYDCEKAIINRDDYLLGKKLDKNLELLSDTTSKESKGGIEAFSDRSDIPQPCSKKSILGVDIVRNEDPLVAIKVKEDCVRREILENPLRMKRLQNIVRSTFDKKMQKMLKKQAKLENRSSLIESRNSRDEAKKSRRLNLPKGFSNSSRHDAKYRERSSYDSRKRYSNSHYSHQRSSNTSRCGSNSSIILPSSHRHRYESSRSEKSLIISHRSNKAKSSSSSPSFSDSDDERKKRLLSGFGLISVKTAGNSKCGLNYSKLSRTKSPSPAHFQKYRSKLPVIQKPAKKEKLSNEEMNHRREEMLRNAKWRDEQRCENLRKCEQWENAEMEKDKKKDNEAVDFIRPMLQEAVESKSLHDRLRSNPGRMQKTYGHMQANFARKN